MSTDNNRQASLYITYDSFKRVMHAARSDKGLNGFLKYMHDDMTHVVQQGHNTDLWLSYYHFPDRKNMPGIEDAHRSDYFNMVTAAARQAGGICRYTTNMRDALFCIERDIVPLTPDSQPDKLMCDPEYRHLYDDLGDNMPRQNAVLPLYRAYQALTTENGVMLFSLTPEGERQRREYERYLELNFFSPEQRGGTLRYWEIIAQPEQVTNAVDRMTTANDDDNRRILQRAYTDTSILSQGRLLREYNMEKNGENYEIYRRRTEQEGGRDKRLLDMTISELWKRIIHPQTTAQGKALTCVEREQFPGENEISTFKIKR